MGETLNHLSRDCVGSDMQYRALVAGLTLDSQELNEAVLSRERCQTSIIDFNVNGARRPTSNRYLNICNRPS